MKEIEILKDAGYTLSDYRAAYKRATGIKGKLTKEQEKDFRAMLKSFVKEQLNIKDIH